MNSERKQTEDVSMQFTDRKCKYLISGQRFSSPATWVNTVHRGASSVSPAGLLCLGRTALHHVYLLSYCEPGLTSRKPRVPSAARSSRVLAPGMPPPPTSVTLFRNKNLNFVAYFLCCNVPAPWASLQGINDSSPINQMPKEAPGGHGRSPHTQQ